MALLRKPVNRAPVWMSKLHTANNLLTSSMVNGSMGGGGGVLKWMVLTGLDSISFSSSNQLKKRLSAL